MNAEAKVRLAQEKMHNLDGAQDALLNLVSIIQNHRAMERNEIIDAIFIQLKNFQSEWHHYYNARNAAQKAVRNGRKI